jgi:hypothetical protein
VRLSRRVRACYPACMLSLFPELLFLSPFAAFLIRVAIAITLAYVSYEHIVRGGSYFLSLGVLEAALALMLLTGFYTQAAALTALFLTIAMLFMPTVRTLPQSTLALIAVMCATLLLTGAGPLAFDLPL